MTDRTGAGLGATNAGKQTWGSVGHGRYGVCWRPAHASHRACFPPALVLHLFYLHIQTQGCCLPDRRMLARDVEACWLRSTGSVYGRVWRRRRQAYIASVQPSTAKLKSILQRKTRLPDDCASSGISNVVHITHCLQLKAPPTPSTTHYTHFFIHHMVWARKPKGWGWGGACVHEPRGETEDYPHPYIHSMKVAVHHRLPQTDPCPSRLDCGILLRPILRRCCRVSV